MSISKGLDTAQPLVVVVAADVDEEDAENLNNAIDFIFCLTSDGAIVSVSFFGRIVLRLLWLQTEPHRVHCYSAQERIQWDWRPSCWLLSHRGHPRPFLDVP